MNKLNLSKTSQKRGIYLFLVLGHQAATSYNKFILTNETYSCLKD